MRPVKSSVIAAATQSRRIILIIPTKEIDIPSGPMHGSIPPKSDSPSIAHLHTLHRLEFQEGIFISLNNTLHRLGAIATVTEQSLAPLPRRGLALRLRRRVVVPVLLRPSLLLR